ncbi:1-phosphofructokinase family hexose kinase [Spirillospora sp. NPDC048911]|uniref:1-phosphofructokinase family hexose kinase n=1 Tax=Spirillospora sp. NPDC048911 TaxID=3364527 RepID=UPI0037161647
MILTVTLNPAWDVTYRVPRLTPHGSHRIGSMLQRPGGKGLNVARVLHALGQPVLATGLAGGATGAMVEAAFDVPNAFVGIAGETRRTVTIVDSDATIFNEPGPEVRLDEWSAFQESFAARAAEATVVVLSGSLPPGLPEDAYAVLTRLARTAGARVLVDADGAALRAAATACPDLLKPNAAEFAAANLPREVDQSLERAPGALVVSRGADGMIAVTPEGCFEAVPHEVVAGNPTGAGDAAAAALAVALRDRLEWPRALGEAVALSAAAVAAPAAGEFDPDVLRRHRRAPKVRETPCPW